MNKQIIQKLTLSAMFLALGMVLPYLTGQIPEIGSMLLPMHIPVFLCALICGWKYGTAIGLILPLLRSLTLSMPPLYVAIAMSAELAAYGFFAGFLYEKSHWKCLISLYRSLILSMIGGRVLWGIAQFILLNIKDTAFTWHMFASGAFLKAFPGIILQLVLIPALMLALGRTGFVNFCHRKKNDVIS